MGKQYRNRPFDTVAELLRMIDEVLRMAPEFGEEMAATPLGAVLDWTMGTTAGFAAYRDPRLNAMLRKVLAVWCEFLDGPESLYVLNDSPTGWKSERARETVGMDQFEHDPADPHWGFTSWNDFFTRRFKDGAAARRRSRRRRGRRQRVRVDAVPDQHRRPATRPVLDQEPALLAGGHARRRRRRRRARRRHRVPGVPQREQLPPLAQPGRRAPSSARTCGRGPTSPRRTARARMRPNPSTRRGTSRTSPPAPSSSSGPTIR